MKIKSSDKSVNETERMASVTITVDANEASGKATNIQKKIAPLTATQAKRLAECEAVFAKSQKEFMKGYEALLCISEEKLYLGTHETFEQYCREKWGISARHANRLILAEAVVQNIKSDQLVSSVPAAVPENEAQSRPLQPLTKEQQVEAARIVAQRPGTHTASDFEEAANEVTGNQQNASEAKASSVKKSDQPKSLGDTNPAPAKESGSIAIKPGKDNSDLERLLELLDNAQTLAKRIAGCGDMAKTLGNLAKEVTGKLNGGGK